MKIEASALADAIRRSAYDRSPSLPALGCVLITAVGGEASILGTNIEIETRISLQADGELSALIPAQTLADIAGQSQGPLDIDAEQDKVRIRCSAGKFKVPTLPVDALPTGAPLIGYVAHARLLGSDLQQILKKTRHARGKNDVRFYLNGTLLEIGGTTATAVATDGHRLAVESCGATVINTESVIRPILPSRAADYLERWMPDGEIQLASDATVVVAEWPGTWIRVQCIDGKYPDWRRVIPNPKHCKASCAGSCAEWAKIIHAASSVAEDKYRACRLEWDSGQVLVTSSGLRGEYAGALPATELTGDGSQGVALDYLDGALGSLSGDRVLLQLINESFLINQPDLDGVRVIMGMRT